MLDRTKPQITYWPTLRAQEYGNAIDLTVGTLRVRGQLQRDP
ncbi:hypothetical protein ACFYPX_06420 [Micromonospora zamorensis]